MECGALLVNVTNSRVDPQHVRLQLEMCENLLRLVRPDADHQPIDWKTRDLNLPRIHLLDEARTEGLVTGPWEAFSGPNQSPFDFFVIRISVSLASIHIEDAFLRVAFPIVARLLGSISPDTPILISTDISARSLASIVEAETKTPPGGLEMLILDDSGEGVSPGSTHWSDEYWRDLNDLDMNIAACAAVETLQPEVAVQAQIVERRRFSTPDTDRLLCERTLDCEYAIPGFIRYVEDLLAEYHLTHHDEVQQAVIIQCSVSTTLAVHAAEMAEELGFDFVYPSEARIDLLDDDDLERIGNADLLVVLRDWLDAPSAQADALAQLVDTSERAMKLASSGKLLSYAIAYADASSRILGDVAREAPVPTRFLAGRPAPGWVDQTVSVSPEATISAAGRMTSAEFWTFVAEAGVTDELVGEVPAARPAIITPWFPRVLMNHGGWIAERIGCQVEQFTPGSAPDHVALLTKQGAVTSNMTAGILAGAKGYERISFPPAVLEHDGLDPDYLQLDRATQLEHRSTFQHQYQEEGWYMALSQYEAAIYLDDFSVRGTDAAKTGVLLEHILDIPQCGIVVLVDFAPADPASRGSEFSSLYSLQSLDAEFRGEWVDLASLEQSRDEADIEYIRSIGHAEGDEKICLLAFDDYIWSTGYALDLAIADSIEHEANLFLSSKKVKEHLARARQIRQLLTEKVERLDERQASIDPESGTDQHDPFRP